MIFLALNLLKIATKWIMNRNSVISIKSNANVSKTHKLNLFLWAYGITVFSWELCFLKRFGTFYFSDFKQKHNNIIQHNWTFWHKHQNNHSFRVWNFCVFRIDFLCFKKEFSQSRICTSESRILSLIYVNFSPESRICSCQSFFVHRHVSEFAVLRDKKRRNSGTRNRGPPPDSFYGSQTNLAISLSHSNWLERGTRQS